MKNLSTHFVFLALFLFFSSVETYAQLTGVKTVGGSSPDYATLSAAISAINSSGVGAGGVTFNVAPGHTENASNLTLTASGTAADPVVFRKSGAGANPLITATAGTSTTMDGIIKISGADYITFDGIDVTDPVANTSTTTRMEWGYAILKSSASNGSDHVTIQNCSVVLQRVYNLTKGIYIANHTPASATALTVTAAGGIHSSISIRSNIVQECYSGIYLLGATSSAYFDDTIAVNKNRIINFGGTTTAAYGVYLQNFKNAEVREDSIYNGLSLTAGFLIYGVYTGNAADANVSIVKNSFTFPLTSTNSTRQMIPVYCTNGAAANRILIDSNRMRSCAYNSTSGDSYIIYTSSSANTVISNNEISSCGRTGTSGKSYLIYSTGAATQRRIDHNTITGYTANIDAYAISVLAGTGDIFNNSVSGSTITSSVYMINTVVGGNIYENTVTGTTCSGSIEDFSYIYAVLTSGDLNIYKNKITSNASSGSIAATWNMYVKAAASSVIKIYENEISGNSHTATSGDGCFALYTTGCPANIYRNTINSITTSSNLMVGIELAATTNTDYAVSRNKIYGLGSTNTSGVVSAIRQISGSRAVIDNNVIGLLTTGSSASGANGINGINVSSTAAATISSLYHNTIYLNATSTGGSNCVLLNTAASATVSNNLLMNLSASGSSATRAACALKRTSATYTSYDASSDNNLLYVGAAPAANRFVYSDGTNSFQTLALYKAYAAIPDQASISKSIPFASLTGSLAGFLQPVDTASIESAGKVIPGIVHDYLLDSSRKAYPLSGQLKGGGTFPDIGAHEQDLVFIDDAAPQIAFEPIPKSIISANKTLNNVSIKDASSVNVSFGTTPRLYFKKSTDANVLAAANNLTENGWKYVETNATANPFTFTIDYSLLYQTGAVADGDVIQYFVVAQDNFTTPNVGVNSATFSAAPASVVLTSAQFPVSSPLSYTLKAGGIPASVTVGASGADYTSLTKTGGLFEAINNGIITNDVTAYIISNLSETGAVALNKFTEDGFGAGSYKVYIQAQQPIGLSVYGSVSGGLIRLNDVERVVFDGSYFGTGQYLSFVNSAATGNNAVFHLAGSAINKGCRNIVVKNCIVWADSSYRNGSNGIFIGGTTISAGTGAAQGYNNRNITLQGNRISKAFNGILVNGITGSKADSIYILNNEIGTDTAGKYIGVNGILLRGVTRSTISGNRIYNIISGYSNTLTGINCDQDVVNTEFSANSISDIIHNANASVPVYGIYSGTSTNNNITIKNNAITKILGQGADKTIQTGPVGIYLNAGNTFNIFNNSVSLGGNRLDNALGNAYTACLFVKSGVTGIKLVNNVMKNVMTSSNLIGPGSNFVIVTEDNNINAFSRLNNNLYYAASSTAGMVNSLALTGTSSRDSLWAWRGFTNADLNSLWGDPGFVSDDNIAPNGTNPNTWNINGRGYPLAEVTADINGAGRSAAINTGATDIGATEFTPGVVPPNATASAAPLAGTTTYYTIAQDTIAEIAWGSASNVPSTIAVKYYSASTPPSPGSSLYMNSYLEVNATPNTGLNYNITVHYKPEAMNTVNESSLILAKKDGTAQWVPFGSTVTNTTRKRMTLSNLTSFSLFAGTDASNPLPVKLIDFSAVRLGQAVYLKWTTAKENNCSGFEIERAVQGGDFEKAGFVNASGNSDVTRKYGFTDQDMDRYAYLVYRIKIIDNNGAVSYSKSIALDAPDENPEAGLAVFPNPFNRSFSLALKHDVAASFDIKDVTGHVVYSGSVKGAGIHELRVGEELAAGVYFIVCKETGETYKIVKL